MVYMQPEVILKFVGGNARTRPDQRLAYIHPSALTVQYIAVLCCTIQPLLYCTVHPLLYCTRRPLQYSTLQCFTVQYSPYCIVQYSPYCIVQYSPHSALLCSAAPYSTALIVDVFGG